MTDCPLLADIHRYAIPRPPQKPTENFQDPSLGYSHSFVPNQGQAIEIKRCCWRQSLTLEPHAKTGRERLRVEAWEELSFLPKDWQGEGDCKPRQTWGRGHQAFGGSAVIKILTLVLLLVMGERHERSGHPKLFDSCHHPEASPGDLAPRNRPHPAW